MTAADFGLDERREVYRLLSRLTAAGRLDWLNWCCEAASGPTLTHRAELKTDLVSEAMDTFWELAEVWKPNLDLCLAELVRRAR